VKRALCILGLAVFVIVMIIAISPAGLLNKNCKKTSGVVTSVYAANPKDAVLKIAGFDVCFYVNKVLEKKITIADLRNKILGKKVTILYADNWTPLDPGSTKQIVSCSVDETVLYSEPE
jgi:hypothetical protein